jgi:hypothetical protein
MFEASKNNRMPVVYPELAERVESLFLRCPTTHIAISGFSKGLKTGTIDIYIKGRRHLRHARR